ncbi:MAG: hypothetical protein EBT92_11760 [Planctomycetes bacterium]|nr:hypothetical protein [Planctomycetota bacterium]NBY02744.1 hypothetical protein [Planctomycetota bacterium]
MGPGFQFVLIILIIAVIIILITRNLPEFTNVETWDESVPEPGKISSDQENLQVAWLNSLAKRKVEIPALFLIGLGGINLIMGSVIMLRSIQIAQIPVEDFERDYEEAKNITRKIMPEAAINLDNQELTIKEIQKKTIWINAVYSCFLLGGSYLMITGGWYMRQFKFLAMVIMGIIYCAMPCISCAGTFGLGQIIAAWCLLTLFNPLVRQEFARIGNRSSQKRDSDC